ncbi:cell division protein FtsA [Bacteroidia bacterium]|nr:cell division protein FtsA [Bacteroidia bacterium]
MEQHIVAIDPGTSKMIAMIAKKEASGKISISRTEKMDSENAIRRGCVYNVDAAAEKTANLISRLNRDYAMPKLRAPIEKVYVSIGGQSMHTERYSIRKQIENGLMIDRPLLNKIEEEAKQYKPELYEVLEILPPEYYVDGQLNASPRGTTASSIEARYQLIVVSNPNLKNLIRRAIPEKIEIVKYIVAPLATAAAVLEKKEKELGCALVEFGAGVTYVSIYKSGILRYLVTIPLGGLAITKDIRCLNVSEEEAENLKKNYGSAIADLEDVRKITIDEGLSTSREIEVRNLNAIIEARMDEILENVIHQIQESGYGDSLGSGIVITGGGAMLRHLEDSFRNKTNRNIRLACPTATGTNQPADYSTIIGLLTLAKKDCVDPSTKEKGGWSGRIFGEDTSVEQPGQEQKPKETTIKPQTPPKPLKEKGGGLFGVMVKKLGDISDNLFSTADFEPDNKNDNNEKNQ